MTETTVPALDDDQAAYVSGLVELAGWLSKNPDAIPPYGDRMLLSLSTNAAVRAFAELHGLDVAFDDEGNASTSLRFGSIEFFAYGYVDFKAHLERSRRERAEDFAAQHGLALVPVDGGAR